MDLPAVRRRRSPRRGRPKIPHWAGIVGLTELLFAIMALRPRTETNELITHALALAAALLAGLLSKWLLDVAAWRPRALHERTVVKTLLLAPLLPLAFPGVFGKSVATPSLAALWFGAGFFCHTLVGDLERMRERETVTVRRREPPLPVPDNDPRPFRPSHS